MIDRINDEILSWIIFKARGGIMETGRLTC